MPIRLKSLQNIDKQYASQIVLVILFLLACVWIAVQPNPFDVKEVSTPPPGQQAGQPDPKTGQSNHPEGQPNQQPGQPNPQAGQLKPQVTPANPQQLAASATAYQMEIENNSDQTTGIVIGGFVLVVMVFTGWLLVLNRR
jgi:hypothetical protein